MSTKVKDALFELIKSLTKSEKRYFKLMSSRHTIGDENNYVRLFDFIDRMEVYDEKLVLKEFKDEALVNRFSITKKRLYDHILGALDAYYLATSEEAQLNKMLHGADILFNKSLYDQAVRQLRSAEKLAIKLEKFAILVDIQKRQKKLLENQGYNKVLDKKELDALYEQDIQNLDWLKLNAQLWKIKSSLFYDLSRKGKARSEQEKLAYREVLTDLPENIPQESGFENHYLFYHIRSAYYYAIGELDRSFEMLENNCRLFEENEKAIVKNLNSYFSLLTNTIYVSERLGLKSYSQQVLDRLKQLPEKYGESMSEDLKIKCFASTASIELGWLTNQGDYDLADKKMPWFEKGIKEYGDKISPVRLAYIQFKIAAVYLAKGDLQLSLKYVNEILNNTELDKNDDILAFTHILNLLIHLELRKKELLHYEVKNTQRFLKNRNRLYPFERVFIKFLVKQLKAENLIEEQELWESFHLELEDFHEDEFENLALEFFDIKSWAASKFSGRSFKLIVQEQQIKKDADLSRA